VIIIKKENRGSFKKGGRQKKSLKKGTKKKRLRERQIVGGEGFKTWVGQKPAVQRNEGQARGNEGNWEGVVFKAGENHVA